MADEFRHGDVVAGRLTENEYEAIGEHIFNSQAQGDMLIATSATQLSRLGITNDRILVSSGGLFSWSATLPAVTFSADNTWSVAQTGVTLTSPTINGTIATTGLTLPTHTTGAITINTSTAILRNLDNSLLYIAGGADVNSALLALYGKTHAADPGKFRLYTPNVALAATERLAISGAIATAVATWTNITHTGLVLSDDLTFSTSVDSALVADEVSLGGFDIAPGQRSLAISQENPVVTEAIGASDRTLPVRINGTDYKILLHT